MKIAITTPTGNVGNHLTRRMLDLGGHELVLLARDPSKLADERSRGARVEEVDLGDAAGVRGATRGVDALFFVCPAHPGISNPRSHYVEMARSGADAVVANGIPHVVLLSSVGAQLTEGTGPILGLHDAEEIFSEATPHLTSLRPTYFMENYLMHVDTIRSAGSVFMPVAGDVVMPMIATRDIAERAAELLTGPAPDRPDTVPLLGPRDYTFDECAAEIGKALGKPVQHVLVTPDQAREAFVSMGATPGFTDALLEMHAGFQSGRIVSGERRSPDSTTPTTFAEFARDVLVPAVRSGDGGSPT